jgi:hypothetical protein
MLVGPGVEHTRISGLCEFVTGFPNTLDCFAFLAPWFIFSLYQLDCQPRICLVNSVLFELVLDALSSPYLTCYLSYLLEPAVSGLVNLPTAQLGSKHIALQLPLAKDF